MAHVEPCVKLRRKEGGALTCDRNKQTKRKKKKIQENGENETCGMEESGGKFPPLLINSMNENQKREKEKKKKRKERRRETEEKEEERERKRKIFPTL